MLQEFVSCLLAWKNSCLFSFCLAYPKMVYWTSANARAVGNRSSGRRGCGLSNTKTFRCVSYRAGLNIKRKSSRNIFACRRGLINWTQKRWEKSRLVDAGELVKWAATAAAKTFHSNFIAFSGFTAAPRSHSRRSYESSLNLMKNKKLFFGYCDCRTIRWERDGVLGRVRWTRVAEFWEQKPVMDSKNNRNFIIPSTKA